MEKESWSEGIELKAPSEIGKPIYKFVEGHNILKVDLSVPPRDATTKFGPKKVIDAVTEKGEEVSVFLPAGMTESSAFGQIVNLARKYGEKEHLIDIICIGSSKARRYTILHSEKCKCGKK
jgi:hypothetical protein